MGCAYGLCLEGPRLLPQLCCAVHVLSRLNLSVKGRCDSGQLCALPATHLRTPPSPAARTLPWDTNKQSYTAWCDWCCLPSRWRAALSSCCQLWPVRPRALQITLSGTRFKWSWKPKNWLGLKFVVWASLAVMGREQAPAARTHHRCLVGWCLLLPSRSIAKADGWATRLQ